MTDPSRRGLERRPDDLEADGDTAAPEEPATADEEDEGAESATVMVIITVARAPATARLGLGLSFYSVLVLVVLFLALDALGSANPLTLDQEQTLMAILASALLFGIALFLYAVLTRAMESGYQRLRSELSGSNTL